MKQSRRATHEVEVVAGGIRIRVTGEIDLAVASDLQSWIAEGIAAHQASQAEVDLSAVTFLDSTGIRALVLAQRAANDVGAVMWISGVRSRVEMVLRLTGVFGLLTTPAGG
ncbi:STAS domain-containing protein [Catelliglobosispora koreensis]|uniref:STAS domain-containing protein n=1 Tax=Catelliglobosispora koreensis TaxID=129052 RepID=UPI000374EF46|nr:STAS domain-containing protein [Catelliglobosispora koreensis]